MVLFIITQVMSVEIVNSLAVCHQMGCTNGLRGSIKNLLSVTCMRSKWGIEMTSEPIQVSNTQAENFICRCGNTHDYFGFFPINNNGDVTDIQDESWDGISWICDKCDQIYTHVKDK